METVLVFTGILFFVVSIIVFTNWATKKFSSKIIDLPEEKRKTYAQAALINSIITDITERQFVGLSQEEAILVGQDLLWEETIKFNEIFNDCLDRGIVDGDHKLLCSMVKIIKITQYMAIINSNGPLRD